MATAYIPRPDGAFDGWQANYVAYVAAHFAELGLASDVVTRLNVAQDGWRQGYDGHVAARATAAAARQAKDAGRTSFEQLIRETSRLIQVHPKLPDAHRAALGITVRDALPTPVGAPATRPLVRVDFSKRLRHRIAYADESTPTRRARPRGVMGAEIWVKLTNPGDPPPADPGELTFLQLSTRTPAVADFTGKDAGQTAHYLLRWLSTRGEAGPWSETASATIGA